MANVKHCRVCDEFGHTPFYCPNKPRAILERKRKLKVYGKYYKKFLKTKKQWFKDNPPDHAGYYYCYIPFCGKALLPPKSLEEGEVVQLDHVESRARRPDLRYEDSNLKPICAKHNSEKGSMSYDEYMAGVKIEPAQ